MPTKQIKVLVSGRVQGVWYRGWTVQKAVSLNVKGWVKNLATGQVEGLFFGEEKDVELLIEACWQGPEQAQVNTIEVFTDDSSVDEITSFRQVHG